MIGKSYMFMPCGLLLLFTVEVSLLMSCQKVVYDLNSLSMLLKHKNLDYKTISTIIPFNVPTMPTKDKLKALLQACCH